MVGSGGVWSTDRGVQVGPGRFPGPSLGQVQGQAARGASEPGGNVDQVGADGGRSGAGVERACQGPGGAGEVVRDRHSSAHAAFAEKDPEGRWASALAAASAMTCSMMAWARCWDSACTISKPLVTIPRGGDTRRTTRSASATG